MSPASHAESRGARPLAAALLLCALGMWTIFGLLFWSLVLVIATVRFVAAVLAGVAGGTKTTEATEGLRNALTFYRRGFIRATDLVFPVEDQALWPQT